MINVVCWGASLPVVKPALVVTTPFRYLLYRYIHAGTLSIPILIHYLPKIPHLWKNILTIIGVELVGTTISLSILYFGLRLTTAIEASLITISSPVFLTLGGIWFLHEKEERHEWIGLVIAFICTLLLTLLPLMEKGALPTSISLLGNSLIILQTIISAAYFLLAKKYYHQLPKIFVTSVSYFVGIVTFFILSFAEAFFSPLALVNRVHTDLRSPAVWIAALYMAVFGSIIGLTALIKGQDGIEVSESSLFSYLQPLVFVPLSIVFLKESFSLTQFFLLCGIIIGVFISEKRFSPPQASRRKKYMI